MFVKIALPIPVNQLYTYSVPDNLLSKISVGKRANVNFHNRIINGVITEKVNKLPESVSIKNIKSILDVVDDIPLFNKHTFNLAFWISSYYFSAIGEVLKIMAPNVQKVKEYKYDKIRLDIQKVQLTNKQKNIVAELKKLNSPDSALIYGITGSGKTEIYFSLMQEYIKKKSRFYIWFLRYR